MRRLLAELRRRNVFRVGAAYLVVAWLAAQVADLLTETYDSPTWVMRLIVGALALGFPVAVALAWFYELTATGLQREGAAVAENPRRLPSGRRLDRAIIVLLTLALTYFAADRLWLSTREIPLPDAAAPAATLAVLPLNNQSADPADEVLADGIADTLLTMLTPVPQLRVISRNSSFSYKGERVDPKTIGEQLGATAVLAGSLQRAGDRLRIAVWLINAADGAQLWAETFDRATEDVFAVQDEIARRVVDALKITLTGRSGPGSAGTRNFEAYELTLRGMYLISLSNVEAVTEGIALLKRAIALDPEYGDAWAALASGYISSSGPGGPWASSGPVSFGQASSLAVQAARRAVEVAPDHVRARLALSRALTFAGLDGAQSELEKARQLGPDDVLVLRVYASRTRLLEGKSAEAAEVMRHAVVLDPRGFQTRLQAGMAFEANGDPPGALKQLAEAIRLEPDSARPIYITAGVLDGVLGRRDEALRFWRKAAMIDPSDAGIGEALALGYAAIGADDLAAHVLEDLRSQQAELDHLMLRAQIELLSNQYDAAVQLLKILRTGSDSDFRTIFVYLDLFGIAHVRTDAQLAIERRGELDPIWSGKALADEATAPPICMVQWSGDEARARQMLKSAEPRWRRLLAFSGTTAAVRREDLLARGLACVGRSDEAIAELQALLDEGYHAGGWRKLSTDPAYAAIRTDPRFEAIVARLRVVAEEERARFMARPDLQPSDIDEL
jgi:TolB-like protein/Flp pilus assembly protein TadD